jgi:polyisoprenoid-binding protein YceI
MSKTDASAVDLAGLTGDYEIDPAHTRLGFVARHAMVSKVRGSIPGATGRLHLDGRDPTRCTAEITVPMANITTDEKQRDEHLRSADFFDVKAHPNLLFRSTRIEVRGGDAYRMIGDLTIRDTTNEVVLDVEFTGADTDPFGNFRVGFEAKGEISRKAWGVTWNAALETGGVMVGDKIKLELDVEAIRPTS